MHTVIDLLKDKGCTFCDYHNYAQADRSVILRHDIDMDIKKAVKMAELLERCLGREVTSVFVHRPSKATLEADYRVGDGRVVNNYGADFSIIINMFLIPDDTGEKMCWGLSKAESITDCMY